MSLEQLRHLLMEAFHPHESKQASAWLAFQPNNHAVAAPTCMS
jgi:hypothetical protein